jgi:hypothetical protein
MDTARSASSSLSSSPRPLGANLATAARFWETWRLAYNGVLLLVAATWVVATWPHFRGAFRLIPFLQLMVLALLANVCYSSAYLVDMPLQASSLGARWTRWRWVLWLVGTVFAVVLEWYWIGDEIYPDFH